MKAQSRPLTMTLGELITTVYDQYGARYAEVLIWFAIQGHRIVSPMPRATLAASHPAPRQMI